MIERTHEADCFGGRVALRATCEPARAAQTDALLAAGVRRMHEIHSVLTRFDPDSELCRLNADARAEVPASSLVRRLVAAVGYAGRLSGGLVDATCLDALEDAGYCSSLRDTTTSAPGRSERRGGRPALPRAAGGWRGVSVPAGAQLVRRPPGVRIDSGGLAKGMAADLIAAGLALLPAFVVDCAGDVRVGGRHELPRALQVRDPDGGAPVHERVVVQGAAATSGVTSRTWIGRDGRAAHHLIDPGRGEPARTGIVQATALAPTALEAEVRAKAALLAGPRRAPSLLPHGGVLVLEDRRLVTVGDVRERVAA